MCLFLVRPSLISTLHLLKLNYIATVLLIYVLFCLFLSLQRKVHGFIMKLCVSVSVQASLQGISLLGL